MSEFDKIKEPKGVIKVYLEDINCTAIAMTSDAGACSLMNEPFLLKSKDKSVSLTEDQIKILQKIGEYDVITKQTKEEEIMDEKVVKELQDELATLKEDKIKLEKQLKTEKVEKEIVDFSFEKDLDVTKVLALMEDEDKGVILKAFTFLKKQIKEKVEDTKLQKELDEENGSDADAEVVVKDLNTRILEARKIEEGK